MVPTRLLLVTGAIAMLSAAPVFAQTNTQTGSTGPHDNTVTTPDGTMNNNAAGSGGGTSTAPRHGMGSSGGMHASSMHGRSTTGSSAMRGGRGDSQDAAVERLNEQSYQAAQKGQSFTGGSSDMGGSSSGGSSSGGPGSSGGMSSGSQSKM